jgi:hypothetical protein
MLRLGSHKEWMGQLTMRHLNRLVGVLHSEHGRLPEGCEGERKVGKGDPNETPRPSRRVGWGIVVGAWESHVHQDED